MRYYILTISGHHCCSSRRRSGAAAPNRHEERLLCFRPDNGADAYGHGGAAHAS
jgi:hypothetical protein